MVVFDRFTGTFWSEKNRYRGLHSESWGTRFDGFGILGGFRVSTIDRERGSFNILRGALNLWILIILEGSHQGPPAPEGGRVWENCLGSCAGSLRR